MTTRVTSTGLPAPLIVIGALFVLVMGYLVWASLTPREAPSYEPTPIGARPITAGATVVETLTVDARDEHRWQFVDLEQRSVVVPPDTAGWDIGVRRFHFITVAGLTDLGAMPLDSVRGVPDSGYIRDRAARDTLNPVIARWYEYSMMTHLLTPNGHAYAVRTSAGRYAAFTILSYYCPALEAGCVTLAYRLPVGMDNSR